MLTGRWVLVFVVQEQTATQHKPALGIQCCLQSTSMLTANDNLLTFTASLSASAVMQVATKLVQPVVEQAESDPAALSLLVGYCIGGRHRDLLERVTSELGQTDILKLLVRLGIQLAFAGHHLCQISQG